MTYDNKFKIRERERERCNMFFLLFKYNIVRSNMFSFFLSIILYHETKIEMQYVFVPF